MISGLTKQRLINFLQQPSTPQFIHGICIVWEGFYISILQHLPELPEDATFFGSISFSFSRTYFGFIFGLLIAIFGFASMFISRLHLTPLYKVLAGVRVLVILFSKIIQYFKGTSSYLTNLLIFQDFVLSLWTYAALQVKPKLTPTTIVDDEQESNYLEIGSGIATMRLLKDLKAIWKKKPDELGFSVQTFRDKKTGLENLYQWEVRFFGFDNKTQLAKDLDSYKKRSGMDYIQLEVRFSKDFPFCPPFVRVVKPKLRFHTGHVTIGGSVCMDILTYHGWKSTHDIESVLVAIRTGLIAGGAQIEVSSYNEYSESEAWSAFYRAAKNHGWNVDGLSPDKFPKLT